MQFFVERARTVGPDFPAPAAALLDEIDTARGARVLPQLADRDGATVTDGVRLAGRQ